MKHQTSKHDEMQASECAGKSLVVPHQASKTRVPGKRALNDPATLPPNAVFSFGGGVAIVVMLSF
jgi:hypothetical protein